MLTSFSISRGIILVVVLAGCQEVTKVLPNASWHQKCGWKAEDYFDDPKVIALCKAIEANDLAEIDRLVASGANVNALGKGNMTPLLWAFPDNKLDRFKRLLEHGANPNIAIDSDFGSRGAMLRGDSVTHMACATSFSGYFDAVFDHGGDPALLKNGAISEEAPIFSVIKGSARDKPAKVKRLISLGANLNQMNGAWSTPTMQAVSWGAQYDVALILLDAGADHRIYKPKSNSRLVHIVLAEEARRQSLWTAQQAADYQKLLKWLEDHGESLDEARKDRERWKAWSITTGEYQRKMAEEVAARMAREAQEKEAKQADNKRINPRQD